MKTGTKRLWLVLIALLAAASILTIACGDDDDDSDTDGDDDDDDDDDDSGDDDDDDEAVDLEWTVTTIDSDGDVGSYNAIAQASTGTLYISYFDATNGQLKLATDASGSWETSVVDDEGTCGEYSSIAVDESGAVHIAHYDSDDTGALRYATDATGDWVTETVQDGAGLYASIAVDDAGSVTIAHVDVDEAEFRVSTNATSDWVTEAVDTADTDWSVFSDTSLVVDGDGKAHAVYHLSDDGDTAENDVLYATNASGAWVTETVDSAENTEITYGSLALGDDGAAHVAYYYHGYGQYYSALMYATNAGGSFASEPVEWSEFNGTYNSIGTDGGRPYISYFDLYNGAVKFATPGTDEWAVTVVDSGTVGQGTALVVEDSGHMHVSYYDQGNGDLKYAAGVPAE